ncbi:MAG: hypothetical protein KAU10_07165, partial [Dehalococcoidia bacterium]|nr:hypothetical protein [Dehalococcoidia bacterium]
LETPEGFPVCQYIANIGLALKEAPAKAGVAYSPINFNALPDIYRPKPPPPLSQILFWPVLIIGIALAALGGYLNMETSTYTSILRAQYSELNELAIARGTQARAYAEEIKALTEEVTSLEASLEQTSNAFTATLADFAATREEVNGDLGQINKLPGAVDLSSVNHNTETIAVQGWGDDEAAVFGYARALRASGRFAVVLIADMHQDEQRTAFKLTLFKELEEPAE